MKTSDPAPSPYSIKTTAPQWEQGFDAEFKNVGWVPENKERVLKFIESERRKAVLEFKEKAIHRIQNYEEELDRFLTIKRIIEEVFTSLYPEK